MGLIYVPLFLMMIFGAKSATAGEITNVTAVQGEDVILPCFCGTRQLEKWQIENPTRVIYTTEQSEQNDLTRVEIYGRKNSSDCSLRLKNIIEADSNTYRCIFKTKPEEKYSYKKIILQVFPLPASARPVVHPSETPGTIPHPENSSKKILVIPIVAFLLIVGCFCTVYLKRRRNQQLQTQKVAEDFSEVI